MEMNKNFFIGFLIGILAFFVYNMLTKRKSSLYTIQDFPDTLSAQQADAQFKTETTAIAGELSKKLTDAMSANVSTEELINITWSYADTSNQLNKDYAAYKLRNRPKTPAP